MKTKETILTGCLIVTLCACSDFLELNESDYYSKGALFMSFDRAKNVVTNVYGYLQDGFANVAGTMQDAATDDAINAWQTTGLKVYYDGSWSPINVIDDQWSHYYAGIRAANFFLENYPEDFPEYEYNEGYQEKLIQWKYYPYEVQVLRAYFHFELLKRYNHIIIAEHTYERNEVNQLEPSSFEEVIQFIVDECDMAAPNLPVSFEKVPGGETGRVTRGTAMALKARALLYAASPLNNPENDRTKWLKAAAAAKSLLDASETNGWYQLIGEETTNNLTAKGLIFDRRIGDSNSFERANFPIGYEGGNSGVCPSQNLAEAFDMRDGTPFDWNNEEHRKNMLNADARDPRFAKVFLCNGNKFKDKILETYQGGFHALPKDGGTPTSYYLRKHVLEWISFTAGSTTTGRHVWPLFRYAEVFLNYAEALGEAQGPTFKGTVNGVNYTMSAKEAVDKVRMRSGMPPLPEGLTKTDFIERVHKERRVELAFEGHRFWDLRRWKTGEATENIWGLVITKNEDDTFEYQRKVVQQRIWENKMYFYPLANSELFKNNKLVQNTGWE
ncbi:RagB/SusD family nutrient uptake outer membrane protein [Parabacteroides pacaensis]|uniref:RagB/SusD family nutrient uptake outer membrane protein n=1 Tax=Parabacteroides pacaensis TaxID=2086575 RepID=UPI000D0FFDA1|nr:RagB/SusD family nutrient uptake outer membrane protein [Parabacteroides pacaensis]